MILKDDVVLLRAIDENDAEVLMDLINDPEIEGSVCGWSYPVSLSAQKKWIDNLTNDTTVRFAIESKGKMIGTVIISSIDMKNRTSNMNIKILKSERGKGFAIRAMKLVICYCFNELNMHCLTANVVEENIDSRKLFERLGFCKDGLLRDRVYKNGDYHNVISFSFLKVEFNERNWQ